MSPVTSGIVSRESPYLERVVQLGIASGQVIRVTFPKESTTTEDGSHPLLDRIFRYLEGTEDDFADVDIALTVPTDHRLIYETVRGIPFGNQLDVSSLVIKMPGVGTEEDDLQRIRAVLAENPIPLLIPDHRVRDAPSGAPPTVEQKLRSLEGL